MSRIKIINFGPIHSTPDNDWIDIKKVTVFIGNQGSGKSTIAKLISTFMWMEKVLVRGDFKEKEFTASKFRNTYCGYHRMSNYFRKNDTEIFYEGEAYSFTYTKENQLILQRTNQKEGSYALPQMIYVPAERNFLSIINKPKLIKELPDALLEFLAEFDNAKSLLKDALHLPVNDALLEYQKQNDTLLIKGKDYAVKLTEASSGFQSVVPLYLVSMYLSESIRNKVAQTNSMSNDEIRRFQTEVTKIWDNDSLSNAQKRIALSLLSARFNKSAFINIVEEPEQNLYPSSQNQLMQSLLEMNNALPANKLIVTTHSPYLVNHLFLSVKAGLLQRRKEAGKEILAEIDKAYPIRSSLAPEELSIYEYREDISYFRALESYEGIPSDEHFLNEWLEHTNEQFAKLLDIEQHFCSAK